MRNPFKPGAGHMPPYLAGRSTEKERFVELLKQTTITENIVMTGLRGVGKTVLLETLKPVAIAHDWLWAGADMSESATITEERLATRLITDISVLTSSYVVQNVKKQPIGFVGEAEMETFSVDYVMLQNLYQSTPGLVSDKLKAVLLFSWSILKGNINGVVFAYDEAQLLADHDKKEQYPLSMLLEIFQSIQKQGVPFLLLLVGLPTLTTKLVDARTYSERMFHIMFLSRLSESESMDAITKPVLKSQMQFELSEVLSIARLSGGYPYFIQFICREMFDACLANLKSGRPPSVPEDAIISKLDNDFFSARWERATDRERDIMLAISKLDNCDIEFSVSEIVKCSQQFLSKPFSASSVSQMLLRLIDKGLIFKNRHGKYSFAVPLLARFIQRQEKLSPDEFDLLI